jgi:hypothetical protein
MPWELLEAIYDIFNGCAIQYRCGIVLSTMAMIFYIMKVRLYYESSLHKMMLLMMLIVISW